MSRNESTTTFFLLRKAKRSVAVALVLSCFAITLPSPAKAAFKDNSGNLPGFASTGAVIGAAVGGVAVVGFVIYYKLHHKGSPDVRLKAPPVRFDGSTPGTPAQKAVAVTNEMSDAVTVKAVTLEGGSGAFALGDARPVPFTLAPGEKFEIPVTLTPSNGGGKARLRIVATTAKQKEGVKFVDVSYGAKSKIARLIP